MENKADIEKIKAKLPKELREAVENNPAALAELIRNQIKIREETYPLKNMIPNVAQERALGCYMQKHPEYDDYPAKMFMFGGNGVGKTSAAVSLLGGATLGPEFLNNEYFNFDYFRDCQEIRRKRSLKVRIVCDKADMEETGSMYLEIKKWIPLAEFKVKTSGQYYTKIRIPSPDIHQFRDTLVDVKTFDMDVIAHAGATVDLIIVNEPPPAKIWAENEARTRGGGRIAAFLTPLHLSAYMHKIVHDDYPDGEVFYTEAPIWDNCADIPGKRGQLARRKIESMVRGWKAQDPLEAESREMGKFVHLAGAVFKIYSDKHVVPNMPIEKNWNIYQIVDHHPHKPAVAVWLALTPLNIIYVFAEYPVEPWDQITGTHLTIKNFGHDFLRIETGKHPNFGYIKYPLQIKNGENRIGDPNAFKAEQPHNRLSILDQYELDCGLQYNVDVDNDIQLRHDKIKDLLLYDPFRTIDTMNTPHLFVFQSCRNVNRAFQSYGYKTKMGSGQGLSDKLDQTWKDWIDAIGYGVVAMDPWAPQAKREFEDDEYADIMRSRIPSVARQLDREEDEFEYETETEEFF